MNGFVYQLVEMLSPPIILSIHSRKSATHDRQDMNELVVYALPDSQGRSTRRPQP